jgi:hypothetical protein
VKIIDKNQLLFSKANTGRFPSETDLNEIYEKIDSNLKA